MDYTKGQSCHFCSASKGCFFGDTIFWTGKDKGIMAEVKLFVGNLELSTDLWRLREFLLDVERSSLSALSGKAFGWTNCLASYTRGRAKRKPTARG